MFELRPYQKQCVNSILKNISEGNRLLLCVLPVGTGKTVIFTHLAPIVKKQNKKTLIIAHREELLQQAKDKLLKVDSTLKVGIDMAEQRPSIDDDVIVASVQSLGNLRSRRLDFYNPESFGLIIIDECFCKGTKIGEKNIEDLKVGDFVDSYNEKLNIIEKKKILRLFKNPAKKLLKISFNGKFLVCTENHPFYINGEWVVASNIKSGDYLTSTIHKDIIIRDVQRKKLCNLREKFYSKIMESNNDSLLLKRMCGCTTKKTNKNCERKLYSLRKIYGRFWREIVNLCKEQPVLLFNGLPKNICKKEGIGNYGKNKQNVRIRSYENKEPNVCRRGTIENEGINERKKIQGAGRKWQINKSTGFIMERIKSSSRIARVSSYNWKNYISRETFLLLQNRLGNSRGKISNRNRWERAQIKNKEGEGFKETVCFRKVRVDSVEVLELGDRERFVEVCPDGFVYNIEVEGNNNYFANGILVHNCHHTSASQYTNILSYFGANKQDGLSERYPVILGVTATPNRADNVGLDLVFDKVAFKYEMKDAIRDKYLAPVKAFSVFTHEKIKVAVRMGDFASNELSKAVNTEKRNQIVVDSYNEKAGGTLAIAFCVDVQHSIDLSKCFSQNGISAISISGKTKPEERKRILDDFKIGKIRVLCNCMLLTEGVDIPQIETVLSCAPTKSSVKYMQSIGRGLRLSEGKTHVNILDFVDNISNNTIVSASSLIGLDRPIKAKGENIFELEEKFEELLENKPGEDISQLEIVDLDKRIQEVDFFAQSQIPILVQTHSSFAWHNTKDGFKLSLGKDETGVGHFIEIKENVLGKYDIRLRSVESVVPSFMNEYKKSKIITEKEVLNVETKVDALKVGDSIILEKKPDRVNLIRQNAKWRKEPPTEKQIEWLSKFGVGNIQNLSKGQASILLTKLFSEKTNKK